VLAAVSGLVFAPSIYRFEKSKDTILLLFLQIPRAVTKHTFRLLQEANKESVVGHSPI